MTAYDIVCAGPGPHVPASGVLGQSDTPPRADVRCPSLSCVKAPDPATVNAQTLQSKAAAALTTNATYLGLASPSTAQNTAQVQALTRQVNALVRLVLNQFDSTTGT